MAAPSPLGTILRAGQWFISPLGGRITGEVVYVLAGGDEMMVLRLVNPVPLAYCKPSTPSTALLS
jgi:hypothetical protein